MLSIIILSKTMFFSISSYCVFVYITVRAISFARCIPIINIQHIASAGPSMPTFNFHNLRM